MAALNYPVKMEADDNDTIRVSFPDFPEAHTFGDDREEALGRAADALATAIDAYIKDRRPIPRPSTGAGAETVTVPALTAVKVQLYETMRQSGIGKAQLATRLNWHLPQVDRLLDVYHGSRLDQLETAFSALGKRMVVSVEDIVPAPRQQQSVSRASARASTRQRVTVRGGKHDPQRHDR
jgi:antitoxin HicB